MVDSYNKRLIGWGTGSLFSIYNNIHPLKLDYLIDNDESKVNKKIKSYNIFSPEKIKNENPNDIIIIIYSMFADDIKKQISKMGKYKVVDIYEFLDHDDINIRFKECMLDNEYPFIKEVTNKFLDIELEIENIKENKSFNFYKTFEVNFWMDILQWIHKDFINYKHLRSIKCLDIGPMYGVLSLYCNKLIKSKNYCMDLSKNEYMDYMIENKDFNFQKAYIEKENIPWKEKFDIILLTEVIEHFRYNPIPTLKKIRGHLSDEGILYISTPNSDVYGKLPFYSSIHDIPNDEDKLKVSYGDQNGHIYVYNKEELIYIVEKSGFKIKRFVENKFGHFNVALTKN